MKSQAQKAKRKRWKKNRSARDKALLEEQLREMSARERRAAWYARTCAGKQSYVDKQTAESRLYGSATWDAYCCRFCRTWHIGHKRKHKEG